MIDRKHKNTNPDILNRHIGTYSNKLTNRCNLKLRLETLLFGPEKLQLGENAKRRNI